MYGINMNIRYKNREIKSEKERKSDKRILTTGEQEGKTQKRLCQIWFLGSGYECFPHLKKFC